MYIKYLTTNPVFSISWIAFLPFFDSFCISQDIFLGFGGFLIFDNIVLPVRRVRLATGEGVTVQKD